MYIFIYMFIFTLIFIYVGATISGEQSGIVTTIDGIDSRMNDLKALFRKGDPLERRSKAATTITAHIRGFLCRTRLAQFQSALMEWKWTRCVIVFFVCTINYCLHHIILLLVLCVWYFGWYILSA
jgi:hypothetical protein